MRQKAPQQPRPALDAAAFRRVIRRFHSDLCRHENLINDLNVFPVPDGDTGTNSVLTVAAALPALDRGRSDLGAVLTALASDLALGARGNSGVILAEYARGMASCGKPAWSIDDLAAALRAAAAAAREAVMMPRAGTMLTIADVVSGVETDEDRGKYAVALSGAAHSALAQTTDLLDELRAAGVVDSGAMVLSLFIDALAAEMTGRDMPELPVERRRCDIVASSYLGPAFEVMFVFEGDAAACESLREELAAIGDSVTVTGMSPYKVHVHVDQPADAVAEGMRHGTVRDVDINRMVAPAPLVTAVPGRIGIVVACSVPGLAALFTEQGAVCLPTTEHVAPATGEFIAAAQVTGCSQVLLLPSDPDSQASAALAAHELVDQGINAHVVGSCSEVESLAVLAVLDQQATMAVILDSAATTLAATRTGAVAVAQRASMTPVGPCQVGDAVGLLEARPWQVSTQATSEDMLGALVHYMLDAGGDLVTVVVGRDGDASVVNQLRADHPGVDFAVHHGGQTATVYLVGVE